MNKIIRYITASVISGTVLLNCAAVAHAEEATDFEAAKQASYDTMPETNSLEGWPQGPQIYGNSAIVMDMDNGAVLYEKKADERHYPASITKLLTALVALENSESDDEVYFSEDSISFLEYGDASIGMTPGEILSRKDAMYGMLLASANEVSYAIAESVGKLMGGTYDTFIQAMNDRSEELGCTGSHWMNANGLHNEQHYTTARDMALIGSAVYQFEEFRTVTQTLNYTIGATNLMAETRTFQQNHKMLWPENYYYYEYCTGGKTGYTDQSRTTLVTMAENGGVRLVAVVLQDDGDVYVDTRTMFDYAFANFTKTLLSSQAKPQEVKAYAEDDAYVLLPSGVEFSSLDHEITAVDEKKKTGKITYYYEGQNVGSADVALTEDYIKEMTGYSADAGTGTDSGKESDKAKSAIPFPVQMLICVVAAIVFLFIVMIILFRYRMMKRKRRRAAMAKRRRMYSNGRAGYGGRQYHSSGSPRVNTGRNKYYDEPGTRDRNGRYR